ncbi:MAG: hypothetical protein RQ824_09175 [bacterium]|nr:hypothetical protein [bacterium]
MDIKINVTGCREDKESCLPGESSEAKEIEPNSLRVFLGILLVIISYITGWPAVSAMASISLYIDEPAIFTYGGPLVYGFSYLLFFLGLYLTGKRHAALFYERLKFMAGRLLMVG